MKTGKTETALPEIEQMLITTAAAQMKDAEAVSGGRLKGRWRRRSAPGVGRLLAFAAIAVLFGGTAMAATGIWDPPIGTNTGAPPPTRSYSPVPAEIANVLGVLRREQAPRDRSLEVEATLSKALFADGIRPGSIRSLSSSGAKGGATVLFAAEKSGSRGEPREQICLYRPSFADIPSEPPICFSLRQLLGGGAFTNYDILAPQRATAAGLVPDGVGTVTAEFSGAPPVTVPVHENYFEVPLHGAELTHRPAGMRQMVWRDADGEVIPQSR